MSRKFYTQLFASVSLNAKTYYQALTILLIVSLLLPASAFSRKFMRDSWTDNDHFWTVTYNVTEGAIHVKVLVYDDQFGPANEDGYVDYGHLSYTTNGSTYIDFYNIDIDSKDGLHITSANGVRNGADVSYTQSVDGRYTYWDFKLNISNSIKAISRIKFTGNWDVNGTYGSDDFDASRTVTVSQMSNLSFKSYGSQNYEWAIEQENNQNVVRAHLSYVTSLNEVDQVSKVALYNGNGTAASRDYNLGINPPPFSVHNSATDSNYYLKQSAYGGRLTQQTSTVNVPAFTFPKTATAVYDTLTQQVTFSWTVDPVTTTNVVKDKFKLQVADNPQFTDAKNVSIDYEPTRTTPYTYVVDKSLSPHLYFRVTRDHTGFNWEVQKSADVPITFTSMKANTVKLALLDDNTAQLNWYPLQAAWLPGASFIITRINTTAKTESQITLTKEDYDKGVYVDKQISICNQYTYTLQVKPPVGSSFTAYAAIPLSNFILPTEIGVIQNLVVSKGYFPDRVELRWSSIGAFDNFIIKRAVYGSNNFVQLASVAGSSNSDYQADDSKGTPGVYYTYSVVGMVKCNNTPVYSHDTLYAVGFRSPTGNIYGRVTYENGQAVENVAVRLQSNDETKLGKSILLSGATQSFLKLDSLITPFTDTALTVEAWIKPTDASPSNQIIFSRANQYELGFNGSGQLYFKYRNNSATGTYTNSNQTFVHVAGVHRKDSLFIMLNGQVIGKVADTYQASSNPAKTVYIGRNQVGNNYKGYIDEMRVWNIALPQSRIERDYTRLLAGDEKGLAAYWRFDETINDQFYDASHHGDEYNQNDGNMITPAVTRSGTVPTADQLALKAFTDSTGNYFISGIPYSGNGTTYTIVPLLGTHQFDPASVNRVMSANSSEFTVDFKDKSSFPVSGFVYYKEGTIPVKGVQFKIDGQYAQQSNGTVIETDDNGKFTISVPVGFHEVKAVKANHVFVNDGKITYLDGTNRNYQAPVSSVTLTDSTTIRFIGRVAGGAIQEAYPLGHSLSSNNLGKQLSVTMTLPIENKYEIFSQVGNNGPTQKTVINKHLLPSNQTDSSKVHRSRVEYQKNKIIIYPDSLTGEFTADLIPEKFKVTTVDATGWGNILPNGNPELVDFSDKFAVLNSVNSFKDSSLNSQSQYVVKNYLDTVRYNASYKFIKRVTPAVEIKQQDGSGKALPYFGNRTYESVSLVGKKDTIIVVDTSKAGKAMYNYGNPVFVQNQVYQFNLKAFEQYPFYESVTNNGVPVVKQQGGKDVVDNVPTSDGFVSILNKIRNGATEADTFSLNDKGSALYEFTAGDPSLATHGIKDFTATVRFGQATNINWTFHGDPQMQVYVMGGKLTGTDFVTAGPDKLLMVLRDPPGSKSFSYVEKGSTISSSSKYTGSLNQDGDLDLTQKLGAEIVTWVGVGGGTIQTLETLTGITFGAHHEEHYTGSDTKESSTTLTTRFQTSDDPLFVGPVADVFVGYSTNITYGQSNNITMVKRADLKATDILLFEPDPSSTYVIAQRSGINIGENFGTLFAYPQQHIEKILIPNLINIRNTALLPKGTSEADAQSLANSSKRSVYISKWPAEDTVHFGKSNNDTRVFGASAAGAVFGDGPGYKILFPTGSLYRNDTIMMLNQYVAAWQQRMADNEKAKLESTLIQNYSFHAGSPIQYSTATSGKGTHENSFSIILSGSVGGSQDVKISGSGFEFKYKESIGTEQGGTFENSTDSVVTTGFSLASNGTDDYFSIDVRQPADSSIGLVFRTKGGVSGCPYAGATLSKYYQPGTVIDQPTQRSEVPKLSVDKPVVNDIPSSRKASYNLTLRNESEAKLPATFILGYSDNDSIKGATIAVDGVSIGGAGRAVVVQYGETVTKVLTLTKGPNAMDYNNIQILLHSGCQYDPTGYQENIADTVLISAHFIPSCSDINIKSPKDKWVLNTESPVNAQGKRYLPITIDQFDVTNSLFDHIELQYKPSSTSSWITAMKFYADTALMNAAQGEKQQITNAQAINYSFVLDDGSFNDQNYDIQAVSYCRLGANNYVTTESNLIAGIKDTYYPRLFGTPQPANGVLGIGDEVRLNFNETIAAGLLTYTDFQVTGIRNGIKGDHSVSVKLDGQTNYVYSEFEKNLSGKNVTAEMWVLANGKADQTIFSQGNTNQSLELALTSDDHLQVTVGSKVIKSAGTYTYKAGEWAHVALVYNATSKTVSAFYNYVEIIHNAPVDAYSGVGRIEYGRSISKQGSLFAGKMHEARIWSDTLTSTQIQVNSLTQLSGAEFGLLAYYPMNEGKGTTVFDKAHGSNASLIGTWSTPAGKALKLNGNSYAKLNTSFAPVTSKMDYTIEMWFKADAAQQNATLASNGKGDGTDGGSSLNLFALGFEKGALTYRNNGFKVSADGNYLDNKWHHVALAVNRNSSTAQLFIDGALNKYFDAKTLGGVASATTYLGVRAYNPPDSITVTKFDNYFTGYVDEFRIWNTYLNQTLISKNNNVRLQGDELGLMAYYPFEKYVMFQNNAQLTYSLSDAKIQLDANTHVPDGTVVNAVETDETAPMKDRGPVDNLKFDYVINNDALIITLQEPRQSIDKTIITFKVKNVRDVNGNAIVSPITWTAYIDQNQLKWSDAELNITKDVYAPAQFESYLVNSGGSSQRYHLDNIPTWLTADPSAGTVGPKDRQKVTFTINPGLNVGRYEELVYMRNDNNESEALKVNVTVKGKNPGWTVNPADFKYNMAVYGKIRINNIFSINKEDMLAAFMNGKCVGVANNTYQSANDFWYAFLTIYSDSVQFNNLEFRIWQASTGKVYQATPAVPVNFTSNGFAGTPANPVIFDGKAMVYQDIVLNQNWNWISFNVVNSQFNNVGALLANGKWASGDIVKNENLGFDQYSTQQGWQGYLAGFNNINMFALKATYAQTLNISGTAADVKTTGIPLKGARWNYISYLPQVNMTVKEALSGYVARDEDIVKSQTGFAMYTSQTGWVGSLGFLEPGKGYMLYRKSTTDTTFYYPLLTGGLTNTIPRGTNINGNERPVPGNYNYAANMTVLATVSPNFDLKPGDSVLAFVGGELRGKAKPLVNPLTNSASYFFTIAGEQEQPVYFMIERNGELIARSTTTLSYQANAMRGTLTKPLVLDFAREITGITMYPNPFKNTVSIQVDLGNATDRHEVQVFVYDVSGKTITGRSKETVSSGIYKTTWNGKTSGGQVVASGTYFITILVDGVPHVQKVIKQ